MRSLHSRKPLCEAEAPTWHLARWELPEGTCMGAVVIFARRGLTLGFDRVCFRAFGFSTGEKQVQSFGFD